MMASHFASTRMKVAQLKSFGVAAIHGHDSSHVQDIRAGKFRFVFISPETAQVAEWRSLFSESKVKKRIALVAVDEAHLISEWGTDFRKAFRQIGGLRALVQAPFMALTASAPPAVQADIISTLFLKDPVVVSSPLDRKNIYISASPIKSLELDFHGIAEMLKSSSGFIIPKMIIYVQTKDMAFRIHSHLQKVSDKKHYVTVYHASLTSTTKTAVYNDFRSGTSTVRCLVSTVAFGMGMDIPDVEVVVVYGTPSTVSQLYQLFGRAGRSRMASRAHLFYNVKKVTLDPNMKIFIEQNGCRRQSLLKSLGSVGEERVCDPCCDICNRGGVTSNRLDILSMPVKPRKRRRVQRTVDPNLQAKLLDTRQRVFEEHPSFSMIGINFLCPDSTIKKLCREAKFYCSTEDCSVQLRAEIKDKFSESLETSVQ